MPAEQGTVAGSWASAGSLLERAAVPVDASILGFFRILIAGTVLWDVLWLISTGGVTERFVDPYFHFKYPFFAWVPRLNGLMPYAYFPLLACLAFAVLVGWRTRTTSKLLCAGVLYWFLIDAANYSDHFYLLCLGTVLVAWLPVNRWLSSDRYWQRRTSTTVPLWTVLFVRGHLVIIYLASALSQVRGDWLHGAPIAEWGALDARFATLVEGTTLPAVAAWISLGIELALVPLLCFRRTRVVGLALSTVWHLSDALWFQAGPSPILMWGLSFMFCDPGWPRRLADRLQPGLERIPFVAGLGWLLTETGRQIDRVVSWFDDTPLFGAASPSAQKPAAGQKPDLGSKKSRQSAGGAGEPSKTPRLNESYAYLLLGWLLIQIVIPLRSVAGTRPEETGSGMRFAWRGQRADRRAELTFSVVQPTRSLRWEITPADEFPVPLAIIYTRQEMERRGWSEGEIRDVVRGTPETLASRIAGMGLTQAEGDRLLEAHERCLTLRMTPRQNRALRGHPDLIRQYAHRVAGILNPLAGEAVAVHAVWSTSLNYRPFEVCLSGKPDLARIETADEMTPLLILPTELLPAQDVRIAEARAWKAEQSDDEDYDLPSEGTPRPREPTPVPPLSPDDEAWLNENLP